MQFIPKGKRKFPVFVLIHRVFLFPDTHLSFYPSLSSYVHSFRFSNQAKEAKAKSETAAENAKDSVKDGLKASKDYVNAKTDQAMAKGEEVKDDFNKSAAGK